MADELTEFQYRRASETIAAALGLHFPRPRWPDLARGLAATAAEVGMGLGAYVDRLIAAPPSQDQLDLLAAHLTIGETYFFRDLRTFLALEHEILPTILRSRRGGSPLRLWSAACCTGEEPYSMAISLGRVIGVTEGRGHSILATDVNSRFLKKAAAGVFTQWSFRDTPPWVLPTYFQPTADRQYEIRADIRRMVRFANLNLVGDAYPSLINGTNAMDVIFCRNVLMYFEEAQARRVIERLFHAQPNGGWLVVGPSELLNASTLPYRAVQIDGAIFYRKEVGRPRMVTVPAPPPEPPSAPPPEPEPPAPVPAPEMKPAESFAARARYLADQGQLAEAIQCCDRWIDADKLDPLAHYLRAVILQEQGQLDAAVESLRAASYLDSRFVLAYVAMGGIAQQQGDRRAARQHLEAAMRLLLSCNADEPLPEADGMTAGRLKEIVESLISMDAS